MLCCRINTDETTFVSSGKLTTDSDVQKRSKRRKAKSLFKRWKRMSLKHTWSMPLLLLLILLAAYYISPGEHNPLHSALHLSYANPALHERTNTLPAHIGNVTQYGKGKKDFAFVAFYTIVFTFTREFCMQRLILPLAIRAGIKSRGKQSRFMEQAYTAMYFAVFGPFGLWVMSRTPVWYFNTTGMYEGFPHRAHESYFKAYYLLQAAYWAQQAIVLMLQLEKPRKDFKELVLHHIITLALIGLSYRFHFTYMGIAVYITHDISDFFLAVSAFILRSYKRIINLTRFPDLQNPQLPRLRPHNPLLHHLHRRLVLHAPLPQPQNPLHPAPQRRIPNRRPLRAQLDHPTIQVLDLTIHYFRSPRDAANGQHFLDRVDLAHSLQGGFQRRCQG
jgi:hypothetical protein